LEHWLSSIPPVAITTEAHRLLPASIRGIDLATGLKKLQNNHLLYHKLLSMFYHKYHLLLIRIEQEIAEGNLAAACRVLHEIKGTAGNLEMTALFTATTHLDAALRQGEMALNLLTDFQQQFEQIMTELAKLPEPLDVADTLVLSE
jgi:HPt (histidine-containing phosphotransfer) domain-containing protein